MTHYPFNRRRHIKERDKLQVSLLAFFLLLGGLVCSYEIYSQNFVRGTQFSSLEGWYAAMKSILRTSFEELSFHRITELERITSRQIILGMRH